MINGSDLNNEVKDYIKKFELFVLKKQLMLKNRGLTDKTIESLK